MGIKPLDRKSTDRAHISAHRTKYLAYVFVSINTFEFNLLYKINQVLS
jgi:hypothetical protein